MNVRKLIRTVALRVRQRPVFSGAIGLAVVVLFVTILSTSSSPTPSSSFFEAKRGDFLISVVEGGTLEAVNEVVIRNEVEGTARIIYIVPEGSYVKKGDLLVELDSSSSQDAVNQQQINVEKAQFAVIQAEQQREIQKSTADSEMAAARLKVEFALSDLDKYVKGEALQLRRNAQIEITNVLENLRMAEERLEWSEKLHKNGYETKANLDKDRLAVSQTTLKLEQAQKAHWMLETFDEPKKKRELEAALQEAKEDLERVKLQGERKLAQCEADLQTQKKTLELSLTKLERDKKQLLATKISAPQDGLVVYAMGGGGGGRFSSESMIEEGAVVRNRQELIKLPDVSEMKLQVKIHEAHINQIHIGQPAYVVLDSMPDQRFRGKVAKVAPLPDSQSRWSNPNLKVYATEIRITEKLPDIKPGVSARADVVITNLEDVLTVPIQAVATLKGQPVAYLATAPPRAVPVNVGMYNNKFIEITSGLTEGDRVLLSPPFDTQEKDLGGAILAQGEALPSADTNQPAGLPARNREINDPERGRTGNERPAENGAFAVVPDPAAGAAPAPQRDGDSSPGRSGRRRELGESGDNSALAEGEAPRTQRRSREGGNLANREEIIKQFDKDGDGQLNDDERAAMRERFGGQRRRGTNAPAGSPAAPR